MVWYNIYVYINLFIIYIYDLTPKKLILSLNYKLIISRKEKKV